MDEHEQVRAIQQETKKMLEIDQNALYDRIVSKKGSTAENEAFPSGEACFVDPKIESEKRRYKLKTGEEMPDLPSLDWTRVAEKASGRKIRSNSGSDIKTASFSGDNVEIIEKIANIKLSSSEEKRKEQIKRIITAIDDTINEMSSKDVFKNTAKVYNNIDKMYLTAGGLKAVFKMGKAQVSVEAKGSFSGDEIICLEKTNGTFVPYVIAIDDQTKDLLNISDKYKMNMEIL